MTYSQLEKSLKSNSFPPQKMLNLTFKYCQFTENDTLLEKGREISKAVKNSFIFFLADILLGFFTSKKPFCKRCFFKKKS